VAPPSAPSSACRSSTKTRHERAKPPNIGHRSISRARLAYGHHAATTRQLSGAAPGATEAVARGDVGGNNDAREQTANIAWLKHGPAVTPSWTRRTPRGDRQTSPRTLDAAVRWLGGRHGGRILGAPVRKRADVAREVIEKLIDDLDGGEAVETVTFGLDGVSYEIDASKRNAGAVRKTFELYIKAGRERTVPGIEPSACVARTEGCEGEARRRPHAAARMGRRERSGDPVAPSDPAGSRRPVQARQRPPTQGPGIAVTRTQPLTPVSQVVPGR
jgi:nucleoid-associated protein Lsr2